MCEFVVNFGKMANIGIQWAPFFWYGKEWYTLIKAARLCKRSSLTWVADITILVTRFACLMHCCQIVEYTFRSI